LYHLDHFALRLANDVDAPPGYGANESFLLEERQRFAYRCPADAERRGELPLIQTQFLLRIVDIGVGDRVLEQRIRLIPQAGRVQWTQRQRSGGRGALNQFRNAVH
jgi:hypothetical protein